MDNSWSMPLLFLVLLYPATMSGKEFCHDESFMAKCNQREVVMVSSASYGRMRLGRCVQVDFGYVGCQSNVLAELDKTCSGRHSCHIPTIASGFTVNNPCLELTRYLEADYKCVPVVRVSPELCRQASYTTVRATSGYLSNLITQETVCGTANSPWVIEVDALQKINFTLFDFNVKNTSKDSAGCIEYATLEEPGSDSPAIICGGHGREMVVYQSKSNKVRVSLRIPTDDGPFFLLRYQAIGCPKLKTTNDMWVKRQGDKVTLGCEFTREQWTIHCKNGKWQGKYGNCSQLLWDMYPGDLYDPFNEMLWNIPSGFVIAVVTSISLVITVTIVVVGIVCLKRHAYEDENANDCPEEKDEKPQEKNGVSTTYVKPKPTGYNCLQETDSPAPDPTSQHTQDNIYRISQAPYPGPSSCEENPASRSSTSLSDHVYTTCAGPDLM